MKALTQSKQVQDTARGMVCAADLALLDSTVPRHVTLPAAGRVLIIGDVHGCCDELNQLLRMHHRAGDTVILVGDVVNKGPSSVAALRRARTLDQCYCVIGNHELNSLRGRAARRGGSSPDSAPMYGWTDELDDSEVEWMRRLPFSIALPAHDSVVVHAGLVPGVPLEAQDSMSMVTMRNLVKESDGTFRPTEKDQPGATAWAHEWRGPPHLYFGHDAKRKLQRAAHATGLDTGCVYGGALSAAILEQGKSVSIVSVQAQREYAPKGKGGKSVSIDSVPAQRENAPKKKGDTSVSVPASPVDRGELRRNSLMKPAIIALAAFLAAAMRWLRARA
jgi:hypothetical protein